MSPLLASSSAKTLLGIEKLVVVILVDISKFVSINIGRILSKHVYLCESGIRR